MSRRADVPRVPEREHAAHMEAVRAVHRRSTYERVLSKITYLEHWERAVTEGVRIGMHQPDDPPLSEHDRDQLRYLRELRDAVRKEMIEHGQIEPD